MGDLLLFGLIVLGTLIVVGYVVYFVVLVELVFSAVWWGGLFVWVVGWLLLVLLFDCLMFRIACGYLLVYCLVVCLLC